MASPPTWIYAKPVILGEVPVTFQQQKQSPGASLNWRRVQSPPFVRRIADRHSDPWRRGGNVVIGPSGGLTKACRAAQIDALFVGLETRTSCCNSLHFALASTSHITR